MQGSFPLAPRPFAAGRRSWPRSTEDEVLQPRAAPARRADHPRGHADLRHARARLQLDAGRGQGRPRAPAPGGAGHQRASRRLPQLPAQPRLQPLVHDRRRARLEARARGDARRARGARRAPSRSASCRRCKLFKIRMDLEMEGGTEALASAGRGRASRRELEPPALRRARHRRDPRRCRARCRSSPSPTRRPPPSSACPSSGCSTTSRGCASAGCCAASRRSSSTAAPASPPTAWASGRCPRSRSSSSAPRMAAFRGISHCYQRPTYADWPYSVFTMAHGRSKEECDAVLDAIAGECDRRRRPRDALLLDRVQEGPPPLLHRRLRARGRREHG